DIVSSCLFSSGSGLVRGETALRYLATTGVSRHAHAIVLVYELLAVLKPADEVAGASCLVEGHRHVLERRPVPGRACRWTGAEWIVQVDVLVEIALAVVREVRDTGAAPHGDLLQKSDDLGRGFITPDAFGRRVAILAVDER